MEFNVRKIRLQALLTQQELADIIGVKVLAVRCWEGGKYKPSLKHQRKLLEFCKERNIEI